MGAMAAIESFADWCDGQAEHQRGGAKRRPAK
jgi:hypothetical protein